jgi:amidase
VENASDGNTTGPRSIEGVEVDELIGWCLTYFANFTGHPAASAAFERLRPWSDSYAIPAARPL